MPVTPAAVLWDMDGTLVDSESLWDVALYEGAEVLGGTLTERQRQTLVGSNVTEIAGYLLEVTGSAVTADSVAQTVAWMRRRTTDLFGNGLRWCKGAREALAMVREAGVQSALVTSTERDLTELALDTIGREFFDITVCGDEVEGMHKPHPRPYLKAAELLGVSPGCCVAVEDSPAGTASAVAAGCTVVVVPNAVAVLPGERRVFRESLADLDIQALGALL
jgi:HAD superfamily hydrolase (TIGR01509 family)